MLKEAANGGSSFSSDRHRQLSHMVENCLDTLSEGIALFPQY